MNEIMNRITTYIFRIVSALLLTFSLVSCLEKIPGDYIPEEEGMTSFNDAEQNLIGNYLA